MEEDQIEKFVATYLKKKGFKQAEHAFQEERQHQQSKNTSSSSITTNSLSDPDLAKHLLAFSEYSLSLSPFYYYFFKQKYKA
jgi:transcription initiation factor TFIID subunit 5